jgi:hypothetical protein
MTQMDETDLVYKGPWVRSAQQRLFQTLETDYAFPRATCRSLVNLIWDFVNETFGEKLHEGQIVFHAALSSEPPGKRISEIKTIPVHLTFHDQTDINVLSEEGTSAQNGKRPTSRFSACPEQSDPIRFDYSGLQVRRSCRFLWNRHLRSDLPVSFRHPILRDPIWKGN